MPSDYDRKEIELMQAEAIRRVREMQARAQHSLAQHAPPANARQEPMRSKRPQHQQQRSAPPHKSPSSHRKAPNKNQGGPLSSLLSGASSLLGGGKGGDKKGGLDFLKLFNLKEFNMDSDRTLILLIIVMLGGETMDEMLLLALLYILF